MLPDLKLELQDARNYVHQRYGPPDPQWRAEARENDRANNAFTDTTTHANEHLAVVFVKSSDDDDLRKHDFTHESTHLLNPVPRSKISYLEEAAATVISMERLDYVNSKAFLAQQHAKLKEPDNAQYLEGYNDLMCLLKECPDEFIKKLRGPNGRSLSTDIEPNDITKLVPRTDAIAQRLCRKFYDA
jgi:hypothetical protein